MISSQDYRNKYEPFYNEMRYYLWPYDVLEILGNLEVEIYTDFPDKDRLLQLFNKLRAQIRETMDEDDELRKAFVNLEKVITSEEEDGYYLISRVAEKNQEKDKVLRLPEEDEEDEELKGGISDENKQSGIIQESYQQQ